MHDPTMAKRLSWTFSRSAAVRADELLAERTLPDDHEAVEQALRRWPVLWAGGDRVRSAAPRYPARRWTTAPLRLPAVSSTPIARKQ